jgi:SHAQKYF class myb-like DNA-binding protein
MGEISNYDPTSEIIAPDIILNNKKSFYQNDEDADKTLTDEDLSLNSHKAAKNFISKINVDYNLHQNKENEKDHDESFLSYRNNFSSRDGKLNYKNDNFNQGRWLPEEHSKFIEAMYLYGNEWKRVQKYIGTRSSTQARSHAQKFFIRLKKKFSFNNDSYDDQTIQKKSDKIMSWIKEFLNLDTLNKNSKVKYKIIYPRMEEETSIQKNFVK